MKWALFPFFRFLYHVNRLSWCCRSSWSSPVNQDAKNIMGAKQSSNNGRGNSRNVANGGAMAAAGLPEGSRVVALDPRIRTRSLNNVGPSLAIPGHPSSFQESDLSSSPEDSSPSPRGILLQGAHSLPSHLFATYTSFLNGKIRSIIFNSLVAISLCVWQTIRLSFLKRCCAFYCDLLILFLDAISLLFSCYFAGVKCPVCSKIVLPDDIELHLVICLTKPRISYNGRVC